MNVLTIENLAFKLPDGFKGSFADALRILARYEGRSKPVCQKKQPAGRLTRKTWDSFLDVVDKGGCLTSIVSIQSWNGKKWTKKKL